MYSAYSAVNCGYGEGMFISQNPLKRDLSNHLEAVLWQIILFTIDQFDTPKKRPKSPLNFCYAGDVTQNLASSYPKIIMLKAIQILGSSSGFVSCRFRKGQPNSGLSLISIPSRKPIGTTYNTDSLLLLLPASQVHNHKGRCCCFRDFRMLSTHSKSNPEGASSSSSSSSSSIQSTILQGNIRKINFCQFCGGPTKHEIPDGEEKVRAICTRCGKITYENPKMVVGCLIEHGKKILMCRRKIHPSFGLWTLPAGYMEIGESAAEGAIRETWEEANAEVEVQSPFAQLDIPLIGQTYMIFLAKLKNPHFSPGPESSECQLFELDDIPFDSLAFSSMLVTLKLYIEDIKVGRPKFHYGIINKRPGTSPSDIHAYTLDFHMQS